MVRSFDNESSSDNKKANYIIIFSIILFLGIISLFFYSQYIDVPNDPITHCPTKELPRGEYVVLFDKTDSDKDSLLIELDVSKELSRIKEILPQYAKLSIYIITDDKVGNYNPVKEPICNPGSLKDENWFVRMGIIGVPKDIQNDWEEKFANIVDQDFKNLLSSSNSDFSPIFEMIQAVNVLNFKNSNNDYENKLFIFSDMLHFMPNEFSLFKDQPNFDLFKKNNSAYYSEIRTTIRKNVTVEINLIPRKEKRQFQNNELEKFWLDYFNDMGSPFVIFNDIGK